MKGTVTLVGAGPGDSGLLTLKGRDALRRADVVVYDALVNPVLLDWSKPNATKLYVGKRGALHAKEQNEINEILLRHAQRGRAVVRLKGGDPFLFGRGGEEAAFLYDHHISFDIVPGVSSATGAAAYAGIPLTDRRLSSMVTMVTGHEGDGKLNRPVDWPRVSRQSTLVIFMGLDQLPVITARLQKHLWPATMPAALIRWGSTPQQQVIEGTLGDIADKAATAKLTSPVLVVIGHVVSLRKKLRWIETRPLYGKKIVLTRAADQAGEFTALLEKSGAEVLSFPTIQILPPKTWDAVDKSLRQLSTYQWILFTSVNGVQAFFQRLKALGGDIRDLHGIRLGAVGAKTSARLEEMGLRVDAFPEEYRADALADALGSVAGSRILLARALEGQDTLPKLLQERGAQVTLAPVYRTAKTRRAVGDLKKRLLQGEIDLVTFTSSSTVDGFMEHFSTREKHRVFAKTKAGVIGPVTATTLKNHGVRPALKAERSTIESFARAIIAHFA